jgi:hypothetical protein
MSMRFIVDARRARAAGRPRVESDAVAQIEYGNFYRALDTLCKKRNIAASKDDRHLAEVFDSYKYFDTPICTTAKAKWMSAAQNDNKKRRRDPAVQALFTLAASLMRHHEIAH